MLPHTVWVWREGWLGTSERCHHSLPLPCPSSLGSAMASCWPCLEGAASFWLGCGTGSCWNRGWNLHPQGGGETSIPYFGSLKQWSRGINPYGRQTWFFLWGLWSQASGRSSLTMLCKLLKMLRRDPILLGVKYTVVDSTAFSPCLPLLLFSTAAPGKHTSCGLEQRSEWKQASDNLSTS